MAHSLKGGCILAYIREFLEPKVVRHLCLVLDQYKAVADPMADYPDPARVYLVAVDPTVQDR